MDSDKVDWSSWVNSPYTSVYVVQYCGCFHSLEVRCAVEWDDDFSVHGRVKGLDCGCEFVILSLFVQDYS